MYRKVVFKFAAILIPSSGVLYYYYSNQKNSQSPQFSSQILSRILPLYIAHAKSKKYSFDEDTTIVRNTFAVPTNPWNHNWDCRAPEQDNKEKSGKFADYVHPDSSEKQHDKAEVPSSSRNLILIRHGKYEMSSTDDKQRVLSEVGKQQAKITGQRLKDLNIQIHKLHYSTMTRATETANIIANFLPQEIFSSSCDLLREGAPYFPEPPTNHWKPQSHKFYQDGARIEAAFRKYFYRADVEQKENTTEVIVCHANVIRYFICRALQLPPEAWLRMSLGNCSMTFITIKPNGRVSMRGLGDTGHLPPDNITFN